MAEADVNRHLLTQFCRGCWNDTLISELQLKQKKSCPPPFAELLLLLRMEDCEASKNLRMKQHLGAAKSKAGAHAQFAHRDREEQGAIAAFTTVTQQLAQQLADVQKQLSLLTASHVNQKQPSFSTAPSSNQGKLLASPASSGHAISTPGRVLFPLW